MSVRPFQTSLRRWGLYPGLLGLLLITGCDLDGYPQDLTYPARTDPVVVDKASKDATAYDKPGEFPNVLFVNLTADEKEKLLRNPSTLKDDQRQQLSQALADIFGSPAHPKVEGTGDLREPLLKLKETLRLDDNTLARGSAVYRQQCLHCHGLTGDGRGATAPWVNPHPRDYRQGVFKFTSSGQDEGVRKPRREDLVRTVREGIEGTSMPSFRLLSDEDVDAVVSYVIHLSMRGETEFQIMRAIFKQELDSSIAEGIGAYLGLVTNNWQAAQGAAIRPEEYPNYKTDDERRQAILHGQELFTKPGEAGCIACHADFGRQAAYKYDVWGTVTRPADVTAGIYRGGRRPIDLFYRVHSGINGTGMTAFGKVLKSKDIWDLVSFLEVLPYPQMRQKYGVKLENN